MEWQKLLSGAIKPGVYHLKASEDLSSLSAPARDHGFALFVFEGKAIADMDDFLDQFEQLMQPPDYGRNWNSFEENFRVLDWIGAERIIVIYKNYENFMTMARPDFDELLDIFIQTVRFRNSRSNNSSLVPLYILLQGDKILDALIEHL